MKYYKKSPVLFLKILVCLLLFTMPVLNCSTDSGDDDADDILSSRAGLFISETALERAKQRITSHTDPYYSSYLVLQSKANAALSETADPFHMDDISTITYSWGGDSDGIDNSLRDAVDKFDVQSNHYRNLALQYALTGDTNYADKALSMMLTWAADHTPVNMYDFHIDFVNATIDDMTSGYTSDRPWNFALDAHWQLYGLLSTCDAYILLTENGYSISSSDESAILDWILDVTEAVNSSFNAWTKWADHHPASGSYERYRSDNHLSWCLAGLLGAASALNDSSLASYVLSGDSWTDSRGGPYANPSYIDEVIDRAIESNGRVFEEKIEREPPIGYSLYHLDAMLLVTQIAEVNYGNTIWPVTGNDGGNMEKALDRYTEFILGENTSFPPPGTDTTSNLQNGYAWIYEIAYAIWGKSRYLDAAATGDRSRFIRQSIGPVVLLLAE